MSQYLVEEYIESDNAEELDRLLAANNALASVITSHRVSPLMLCCYFKKHDLAKVVLKYLPEITFFEACAIGDNDHVKNALQANPELSQHFSDDGFSPLGLASYFGREDVVRTLLLHGAEPNVPSQNGYRVFPIHSATASNDDMIVKMLLEAGAEVNVSQMSGVTPLHSAAYNGNIELLILLLEAGADVNAKTDDGKKASDKASEKGFHEIAKILN